VRCLAGACFARDASDACAHMLCAPPVAAKVRRALSVAIGSGALASRFLGGNGFSVLEARPPHARSRVLQSCVHALTPAWRRRCTWCRTCGALTCCGTRCPGSRSARSASWSEGASAARPRALYKPPAS
jgi:hypothetical protein